MVSVGCWNDIVWYSNSNINVDYVCDAMGGEFMISQSELILAAKEEYKKAEYYVNLYQEKNYKQELRKWELRKLLYEVVLIFLYSTDSGVSGLKGSIKNRRLEIGITMKELADKVGVSEATVSRWESGEISSIPHIRLIELSRALQVSPIELVEYEY